MESIIDETIRPEDLVAARERFLSQCARGTPSQTAIFDYAYAMIRSENKFDIKEGIDYLEKLARGDDSENVRIYVFYLAVGHARLKQFDIALQYNDALLTSEPDNLQAKKLKENIKALVTHDGIIGAAIVGGGIFAVAGIIALLLTSGRR